MLHLHPVLRTMDISHLSIYIFVTDRIETHYLCLIKVSQYLDSSAISLLHGEDRSEQKVSEKKLRKMKNTKSLN